ncbi:glycosyl transferase family 2 [Thermoplasmatales archaeon ex4484_30]|nr:MAG: glycosyl transferase family 2 [Thermoplasmatales archaeon ex4484_30]
MFGQGNNKAPAKNEEKSIGELLDSLVVQERPIEVVVVDAKSSDATREIVKKYSEKHSFIHLYIKGGKISESLNYGIEKAKGEAIAFIGADDKADKEWIRNVRKALKEGNDIVIGRCIEAGETRFKLDRVKLYYKGFDISVPGTNTTYRKEILKKLGGFDPRFVAAEDMDLNLRAIEAGYRLHYEKNAIVYRYARDNAIAFLKQAYRNGYGRKQLTLKHGKLWKQYSFKQMFSTHITFWGILRLSFGLLGYLVCKITGGGMKRRKAK